MGQGNVWRRTGIGLALVLAAVGLAGLTACATSIDDEEPAVGVSEVEVRDDYFSPRVIQVPAGTEVTWEWSAQRDHNVVGDSYQSELMRSGTFAHTFDAAGTYDYVCTLHAGMTGRVVVTE